MPAPETPAAAPWQPVFEQLQTRLTDGRARAARLDAPAPAAAAALARAHSRLLIALDRTPSTPMRLVSELVDDAAELVVAVAEFPVAPGSSGEEKRARLVDDLRSCLCAHENAVLAGELTYELARHEGEDPAVKLRHALSGPSRGNAISQVDLASLRLAATELAATLIRAAANLTISGDAAHAPQTLSRALKESLHAITSELRSNAHARDRPVDARGDVVAHHLAQGLRIRTARENLDALAHTTNGATDTPTLKNARAAWLRLAICEYIAITALDAQLDTPTYIERFASPDDAMQDAASNVLTGGRLVDRGSAFAHSRAWRHQTVGLTYALEAYIAGVRGHTPSLAQAQLITLTRLARSITAIATLDLRRPAPAPGDDS